MVKVKKRVIEARNRHGDEKKAASWRSKESMSSIGLKRRDGYGGSEGVI